MKVDARYAVLVVLASGCLFAGQAPAQVPDRMGKAAAPAVQLSDSTRHPVIPRGDSLGALSAVSVAIGVPQGGLFIVDNRGKRVIVTDAGGRIRARATFEALSASLTRVSALAHGERNQLYIYDGSAQRIGVVALRGKQIDWLRSFPVPVEASSMCIANGIVVVLGAKGGQMLHEFRLDGAPTRAFGAVDPKESAVAEQTLLASGHIACDSGSKTVIVADGTHPTVRAFRLDGGASPVWSATIPEYRGVDIETLPDGTVEYHIPPAGADVVKQLVVFGDSAIGVQILRAKRPPRHTGSPWPVETRLFALKTGNSLGVTMALPLLNGVDRDVAWRIENDTLPHVEVYRIGHERGNHL